MELQYEKALDEYGLNVSDLPEDAKIGIENIISVQKGIHMANKKGKQPSQKVVKKLKAMDKWVYYEILDHIEGTDENDEEIPYTDDEVIKDIENETKTNSDNKAATDIGFLVEQELTELHNKGQADWTIDEIEDLAPKTFKVLWDSYSDGEENGIVTTKFKLIEKVQGTFTLTKK
jgi:hypothetical protein